MNLCRTLSDARCLTTAAPTTPARPTPLRAALSVPRVCEVCLHLLPPGARSSARTCSSKCRSIKSRRRRYADLAVRLRATEKALRDAADDIGEYLVLVEASIGKVAR